MIQPIVENAVRHGMGDDDALRIDVTVHQDGEDAILIAVADNGVGMDEGTAARLFDERSARPDASSPQGGGARCGHAQYFGAHPSLLWAALLYACRIGAGQGHQSAPSSRFVGEHLRHSRVE